jgi:hypothetical protein
MGKSNWDVSGNLASKINSPISFITGANLKKKPPKKKPEKKHKKK